MNDNFLKALQAQQGFSDLGAAEVRSAKDTLYRHKSAQSNFGANTKIDIIRGRSPSHQQFAFLLVTRFFSVAIWIKNYSARDCVLLRCIAKDESITEKRKDRRFQL